MFLQKLYSVQGMSRRVTPNGEFPTTKKLYKNFMIMAWPAMVESVLMSLVNIVDTIMVSNCGTIAVSAVGLTTQPRMIFYSVFFALNIAVTAIVARRKGQNDKDGANACLMQTLGLTSLLAVVLCGLAVLNAEALVKMAGAKEDTLGMATTYFRITMVGLIFTSVGMVINGAQRGSGNTKISMRTNVVANLTNIVFNALLINGFWVFPKWGVAGAAIATLIGNIASFVMSVFSLYGKNSYVNFNFCGLVKWQKSLLQTIGKVALGAGTEQIFVRVGFLIYAKIVAELGTVEYATHTICMSIITLSFSVGDGLSSASSALIGQNLGKKRPDMATLYAKAGQRIGFLISVLLIILFVFAGDFMLDLFAKNDDPFYKDVMQMGRNLTFIIAFVAPGQISQVIYNGALRGAGDTKFVAVTSAISIAVIRPIVAFVLCNPNGIIPWYAGIGIYGAWISLWLDQYIRLAFSAYRFKGGKWQKINI